MKLVQVEYHKSKKAKGTLALWEVENPNRFGVVKLVKGEILEFQEKPPRGEELSNLINAGTYILEPEIISIIPENEKISIFLDLGYLLCGIYPLEYKVSHHHLGLLLLPK